MLKHNIPKRWEKFVVLGNPKYDKIRRLIKSEYPLRDDWKEKLLDESGK